ncbi:hypothetical protein K438DRAFT_1786884 [Mycena galopus ATCC 62051]|nr:hypothetical protein K438DRAFT_1786884 [Mycena galopus ATCC 62051]
MDKSATQAHQCDSATPTPTILVYTPSDLAENLLAIDGDANDDLLASTVAQEHEDMHGTVMTENPVASSSSEFPSPRAKRKSEDMDVGERKKKITKIAAESDRVSPFFASTHSDSESFPIHVASKSKGAYTKKGKTRTNAPVPAAGLSRAATTARQMNKAVLRDGNFVPSAARTKNFRAKCREWDSECQFEPTCTLVQCSSCKVWKKMSEPYNTKYFRRHTESVNCSPPAPIPVPSTKSIGSFFTKSVTRSKAKERPQKFSVPCPGLTVVYDVRDRWRGPCPWPLQPAALQEGIRRSICGSEAASSYHSES